jgi:hypothetical protein
MTHHIIYPLFYLLITLASVALVSYAMHVRYVNEGVPVSKGVIRSLSYLSVFFFLWTASTALAYA